ncbi:hypothetical protein [Corynebacterium halotolerans]|uniref:Putative cell-surface hemin receptor n=1 Tax=Corynebacterium halotolerans YIM 70093 = DSM 44683 TaxID=1121362 RepID=M1NUD5_9CORY|nr:hypothetical protein [Corynebacterium halotolerans]AGF71120.1 putative cell-surface hemin receptor [Corynebacterium halotolerans YIM 70093 = DSM 44683]
MNTTRCISGTTATVVAGSAPVIPAVAATDGSGVATGASNGGTFPRGASATFLGHPASPMAGGRVTGSGGAAFADGEFTSPVNAENPAIGSQCSAVTAFDGGAEPTEGEADDGIPPIASTWADPLTPATGEFSAVQMGTFAAQGAVDSLGRYAPDPGMATASLDLSFAEYHEPAPTPTAGSSSGGPGLAVLFAVPDGTAAPAADAPGAIPAPQLLA